jgi:hypothetical protein
MIMGLPGDTLENFYNEFNIFQQIGNWDSPRNMLTLLPNTEAYSEEYKQKYGIKSIMVGSFENEEQDVYLLI